jgi:hypothetical protein
MLINSMILLVINGLITSYFFMGFLLFMLIAIVIVKEGHDDYEWY